MWETHKTHLILWSVGGTSGSPSFHHLSVNDADINRQQEKNENIIQQSQNPKCTLWNDVQGRDEVDDSDDNTNDDTQTEHEEKTSNSEELAPGVAQQSWQVTDVVHDLLEGTTMITMTHDVSLSSHSSGSKGKGQEFTSMTKNHQTIIQRQDKRMEF